MKKRVIFTGADTRYIDLFLEMFYPTLRHLGRYRGDVKVLLMGAIAPRVLAALKRHDLALETGLSAFEPNQLWKFEYAYRLQQEYEEVYLFDCDIWFQCDVAPLFELAEPGKLLVCEEFTRFEPERFRRDLGFNEEKTNAMLHMVSAGTRRAIIRAFSGRRILNCGFFGGRRVGEILHAFCHFCQGWPRIGFGFDQVILNLWDHYFPETVQRIPARFALALCTPASDLHVGLFSQLMLGAEPVVAAHANNYITVREKLNEPNFVRLMAGHPRCKPLLRSARPQRPADEPLRENGWSVTRHFAAEIGGKDLH